MPTFTDLVLEIASSCVGMSAHPAEGRIDEFEALMGYGETAAVKHAMSSFRDPIHGNSVSTCGLFVRGVLWEAAHDANPDAPNVAELAPPYKPATVFNQLRSLANRMGAWVEWRKGNLPEPGDFVIVDLPMPSAHVFIASSVTAAGEGASIEAIEAGQVTLLGGYQAVRRKLHTWRLVGGAMKDDAIQVPPIDTFEGHTKTVSAWISMKAVGDAIGFPL